ncbi:hypothetical protein RJ641_007890 [Dillenia turbinata]|uniref:Protein GAMETE EXPRESSED 1 n=1 Tax=Dillenia turbinata TaxID=194707 RepID=A0AAN8V9P6_9MAGN
MSRNLYLLFLLMILCLSTECQSWGWFQSSKETNSQPDASQNNYLPNGVVAEFSMEGLNDPKGIKLVENARKKLVGANSCWQKAYQNLFAGCSEIIADKEKQSRLAWDLSDCFQRDSGRSSFPACDSKSPMLKCLKILDEDSHRVYLEFFLEANSICHQLQTDAFKRQTERLVNELKKSAEFAEEKLELIEENAERLLQNSGQIHDSLISIDLQTRENAERLLQSSGQIHDSLTSIDLQTQELVKSSKDVEDHIEFIANHSNAIYEQTKGIAASQLELSAGQARMKEKMEEGMAMLHESYSGLRKEIGVLKDEAIEIEKEINNVGKAMSLKMENLQSKADDIGNMAGISLDKQKQLLDGQSVAIEGLQFLTKFQSQALEESRVTLQQLAEFGHKQQEELLHRQEQLQRAHDHLVENSKTILAAQEAFESKQATMFVALDKLFALHNAMLLESRFIKAFFIYFLSMFVLYMFTSTKQTYSVRPRLYIGLCFALVVECAIIRFTKDDIERQTWIINSVRLVFATLGLLQLLYAVYSYKNYEVLNHEMLLTLMEKVNGMEREKREKQMLSYYGYDSDSDVNWCKWVDVELPEEVNELEDPDFLLPEQVGENSVITSSIARKYNLRQRRS